MKYKRGIKQPFTLMLLLSLYVLNAGAFERPAWISKAVVNDPETIDSEFVFYPSWMSNIRDDQPLHTMSIPGTHDSGAMYEIAPCADGTSLLTMAIPLVGQAAYAASAAVCRGGGVARTQGVSIWEQLLSGVRYLDIRLRKTPAQTLDGEPYLTVWHGEAYQLQTFTSVYAAAAEFVHQHPSEAVVISIRDEGQNKPLGWIPLRADLYAEPRVLASALNNVIGYCKKLNKEMQKLAKCEGRITELKRAENELRKDKSTTGERRVRILKRMALSEINDEKCIVGGKPCSSYLWSRRADGKRFASDITPMLWGTKPAEPLRMKHVRGKVIVTSATAFRPNRSRAPRFRPVFDYFKANNYAAHLAGVRIYVNDKEHKPLSNTLKTENSTFNSATDFRLLELNNLHLPADGPRSRASHVNEAFFWDLAQAKAAEDDATKPGLGFVAADFPGHLLIHSVFTDNGNVKKSWKSFLKSEPAIVLPRRQLTYKDCSNALMLNSCVKVAKSVFIKYADKFAREEQCGGTATECLIQAARRPKFLMAPPPK